MSDGKCGRCGKPAEGTKVFCPDCFADPSRLVARTRGVAGDARRTRLADLERVVIDGAIRFRRAETAAWVTSEVGTVEEAAAAKAERPRAYIAMVNAVDALLREREGKQ